MASDIIVIGGGIIGAGVARELARAGARVTVLAREEPEQSASWAALGLLVPTMIGGPAGPAWVGLAQASLSRYPRWVAEIEVASGMSVGLQPVGFMEVALREGTTELEAELALQRQGGIQIEPISTAEARRRAPLLSPDVSGALYYPNALAVDNRRLSRAAVLAAEAAGARFEWGVEVRGYLPDSGGAVAGVRTTEREVRGDAVVNAAGAWATTFDPARHGQVRPVRGQALRLQPRHGAAADTNVFPPTVISWRHNYLIPRDGFILAGATIEDAGYDGSATAAGVYELIGKTLRMAPALARARVVESWAGLRPGTDDGLPLLGADPQRPGLFYATGHFRNGILLAPITAAVIAGLVQGQVPSLDLDTFSPGRF